MTVFETRSASPRRVGAVFMTSFSSTVLYASLIHMELLRDFRQIDRGDAALAGGKGASLGEMTQAGIIVPPGFVFLSSAFERFFYETGLNVEIDTILHKVVYKEMHTVDRASEDIQALILEAKMPKDIEFEIKKNFKKLGAKFVAVRSSATAEDSAS